MEIPEDIRKTALNLAMSATSLGDCNEAADEIAEALMAERERCATIAESFFQDEAGKRYAPFDVPNIIGSSIRRGSSHRGAE